MDESIDVQEVLSLAKEKLEHPGAGVEFRLRSVVAEAGELQITFWWEHNPTIFGVKLAIPNSSRDPIWTRWDPGTTDEWVEYAVRVTVMEELLTGLTRRAPRSRSEGVTWLDLKEDPATAAFHIREVEPGDSDTRRLQAAGFEAARPQSVREEGRLLLWRYAISTDQSGHILGAISVESGDPPAVCSFDVASGVTHEVTRALLMDAVYAVEDLGWSTVVAHHGPEWLTSWGFAADDAGVLVLDSSSS